ncbi:MULTISPECIES: class I SAM-dependent methyltransferase [unclassified Nonomuraea]|uniref:class I SAM-dependent methyltransferase n=1 Tax=unclassified Nonomuraea TaxID=2593643 RepID=UPI0033D76C8C
MSDASTRTRGCTTRCSRAAGPRSTPTGHTPIGKAGACWNSGGGTGHKLIPIASDGHPCVGLDFSSDMPAEARRKADERGVVAEWTRGDMRAFDLGRTFAGAAAAPLARRPPAR